MSALLWNLILALLWGAASGSFAFSNLAFGFAIGFLVFASFREETGTSVYINGTGEGLRLLALFLRELIVSNLRVAYEVVSPRHHMTPALLAIELDAKDDLEIILLANMITLTPGNLVVEISEDRKTLFLHAMYAEDVEQVRREVKEGFERAVLRMTR